QPAWLARHVQPARPHGRVFVLLATQTTLQSSEDVSMKYSVLPRCAGAFLWCVAGVSMAAEPDAAKLEKGKAIFMTEAVPACAVCHTLDDAGATGAIGPNLDELKPSYEHVRKMVMEG